MGLTIYANEIPILFSELEKEYTINKTPNGDFIDTPDGAGIYINHQNDNVNYFDINFTSYEIDNNGSQVFKNLFEKYKMMTEDDYDEYLHKLINDGDYIKSWILTVSIGYTDVVHYNCFCKDSPVDILMKEDNFLYYDLLDELFNEYNDLEYPEDYEDWEEWEQDEWWNEKYNDWCENISFEVIESIPNEHFETLIDER